MVLVELGNSRFQLQRLARLLQALHKIGGARKQHTIAVFDKGAPDGSGNMRLSRTGQSSVIVPGVWDQKC